MRFSMFLVLALVASSSFAADKKAAKGSEVQTIALDTAASKVTWTGKKVKGQHTGTVQFKEGKFEFKKNTMVGGEVVVDLNTLQDTDLTDAEYNKKLIGHLKSEDFFDVAKFPTATFKITSFKEIHSFAPGAPNAEAKGTLTIRGVTKTAEVKLFYKAQEGGFQAKGKLEVDRTLYGVKYNSKKFFSLAELGDKLVDDVFTLDLDLVAGKAVAAAAPAASPAAKN